MRKSFCRNSLLSEMSVYFVFLLYHDTEIICDNIVCVHCTAHAGAALRDGLGHCTVSMGSWSWSFGLLLWWAFESRKPFHVHVCVFTTSPWGGCIVILTSELCLGVAMVGLINNSDKAGRLWVTADLGPNFIDLLSRKKITYQEIFF